MPSVAATAFLCATFSVWRRPTRLPTIRDRPPLETHASVFRMVLGIAAEKKLLKGKTVAIDSTTLEVNEHTKTIDRAHHLD